MVHGRVARVDPQPCRAVRRSSKDTTRPAVLTDALLTRVYEHPVRVVDVDGGLVVVPVRPHTGPTTRTEEASCVTP